MILSLGEDRCEEENDKVFTRSALIESDLRRASEEVKAKKENQLRRAYVRARGRGTKPGSTESAHAPGESGEVATESSPFFFNCSPV